MVSFLTVDKNINIFNRFNFTDPSSQVPDPVLGFMEIAITDPDPDTGFDEQKNWKILW